MSAKSYGWDVGMRVFAVETHNRSVPATYWATVTKVGRVWVTFQRDGQEDWARGRFCAETMMMDGGQYTPPGRVFNSEDEYLDSTQKQKEWVELCRSISSYRVPPHLSLEAIRRIAAEVAGPAS